MKKLFIKFLIGIVICVVFVVTTQIVLKNYKTEAKATPTPKIEAKVIVPPNKLIMLINKKRSENGKQPLIEIENLDQGAYQRAINREKNDSLSHDNYIESIQAQLNDKSGDVGEELARYQTTPEEVLTDWFAEPSHKKVMLEDFVYAGIGHYKDYWVFWMSTKQ